MTVAELITKLQTLPPETLVATSCCNGYDIGELNGKVDLAGGADLMQLHQIRDYPKMFMVDDRDDPLDTLVDSTGDEFHRGAGVVQTPTPIVVIE